MENGKWKLAENQNNCFAPANYEVRGTTRKKQWEAYRPILLIFDFQISVFNFLEWT